MAIEPTKPANWPARAPFARSGSALELSRPVRVVARDGAPGIVVDARVLAVRPELGDAEALVLDLALRTYEATHRTKTDAQKLMGAIQALKDAFDGRAAKKAEETGGVRLSSEHVAEITGLTSTEAAAVIASLIARRLLLAEPDTLGGTDGWRPVLPN